MANPFYSALGGGKQPNMMQMLQQLRSNPLQFLAQRKFNLPQNIDANNPQAIVNHLVQSGQVPQEMYNRAQQMARQMGMK